MRRYHRSAFVASIVVLSLVALVVAQSALGTVRGTVKDASGVVLPSVEVRLSRGGRADRTTLTDQKGEFSFAGIEPGRYSVRAALAGFQTIMVRADVTAGNTLTLSFTLQVGRVEETVTVTAETPSVTRDNIVPAARTRAGSGAGIGVGVVAPGEVGAQLPPHPARPFNTEAYDKIDDNQWTAVAARPLSTFSIDVDTASYANVRRFLNQGQRPPKDAVRIEELINYFRYDYPPPRDGQPFAVTTALAASPWNARHVLALIGLQARRLERDTSPPRNLVFLIDVSGSMMTPQKLPLVKASLAMLAPNLTARDRVAIVVYAGAAGLVLPSTSGADTQTIVDSLARLEAGGSTNGAAGLLLAYRVAQEHFIKDGVNRVVLATDGDFNVGVTNQGDLTRLIEEKRQSGITLSVLGFGMGNLKDSTMEKLADKGNGNYAYIDSLAEAQKVLVDEAGGTFVMVAKDVKLQIEFNPQRVAAYRLIGYENRILQDQDFNNDRKDAGDMGAGHSVTALYELLPAGAPIDIPGVDALKYQQPRSLTAASQQDEALTVKLRYKQPGSETSALIAATVPNRLSMTPALGFAAAVAEFGMLLRDSEHKGSSSFPGAAELARTFKGDDPHGHRAEFIRLIEAAAGVSLVSAAQRDR
jgi:Ca-activated chloride channel family protein